MEYTFRRTRRITATAPICIALLLSGCGGGGTLDLSSLYNPVTTCDNGAANYTPISSPVTAIAAAARVSFAITDDGSLWAWGSNTKGQLGAGATTNSISPVKIGTDFQTVSAGFGHSLALQKDGTLWAWGDNNSGQLGDGTTTNRDKPIHIGSNSDTYKAVSAGLNFSLAIKSDGTLWAWGDNSFGQLGIGSSTPTYSTVPMQVGSDNDYMAVSAGTGHALALKSDNSLWAWGDNFYGELGEGCSMDATSGTLCANSNVPVAVDSGSNYGAIASGYYYSLGIRLDGTLMTWGNNVQGKPANPAVTDHFPTQIGTGFKPEMAALSASKFSVLGNGAGYYYHSLALQNNGSLWAWGDNTFGQLGDNNPPTPVPTPEAILASSGYAFTAISAGDDDHSLAIKDDGTLWAWGSNSCGQLGDGTTTSSYVPKRVSK
jgi:alpha-tubulin suppressor-like RCC1 family protein